MLRGAIVLAAAKSARCAQRRPELRRNARLTERPPMNDLRSSVHRLYTTTDAQEEKIIQRAKEIWTRHENDAKIKRRLEEIFEKFDERSNSCALNPSNPGGPPRASDLAELKYLKYYAPSMFDPSHSKPNRSEMFSFAILNVGTIYARSEHLATKARLAFEQTLQFNPHCSEAWRLLSDLELRQKNIRKAMECLQKCVSISPLYVPAYSDLASLYMMEKKFDCAVAIIEKTLKLDDSNPILHMNLAICREQAGQWASASVHYRKTVAKIPENDNAVLGLARCLIQMNQWREAADLLFQFTEKFPGHEKALLVLGCVLLEIQQVAAAAECFESVLDINGSSIIARRKLAEISLNNQCYETSLNHYLALRALDPSDSSVHLEIARIYRRLSRAEEAVDCYLAVLKQDPDSFESNLAVGTIFHELTLDEKATPYLKMALKSKADCVDALYALGKIEKAKNNLSSSKEHFQNALQAFVKTLPTLLLRCLNHLPRGQYKLFDADLDFLLNNIKSPIDSLIQTLINYAELSSGAGYVQEAKVVYFAVLKYSCHHVTAHYNLAKLFEALGDVDSALKHYGILSEIHPIADVHFSLARNLLLKENMSDKVIENLVKATEIQPLLKPAWDLLAHTYFTQQKYEHAQKSYKKITQLDPRDLNAHLHIGICLSKLNRYREAEAVYRHIIHLDPNYAPPYYHLSSIHFSSGRTGQALKNMSKYLTLSPDDANAHLSYAVHLLALNDQKLKRTAIEHLNEVVKRAPHLVPSNYLPLLDTHAVTNP